VSTALRARPGFKRRVEEDVPRAIPGRGRAQCSHRAAERLLTPGFADVLIEAIVALRARFRLAAPLRRPTGGGEVGVAAGRRSAPTHVYCCLKVKKPLASLL
jgi:hypothetical protein